MRLAAPTGDDRAGAPGLAGVPYVLDEPPHHGVWHERLTIIAAALGTLAVIFAAMLMAGGQEEAQNPRDLLTDLGRRAVETLPEAYQSGDSVIVPAASASYVARANYIDPDLFQSEPVPLYVRGLAPYGSMRAPIGSPLWTAKITASDNIFVDVGQLSVACMRWPGEEACAPTLLAADGGRYYVFQSGIGSQDFLQPESEMEGYVFDAVSGGERVRLVFGGLPGTTTHSVKVEMEDGIVETAETSLGNPFLGSTIWWTTAAEPVETVTAYDLDGQVVDRLEAMP